MITNYLAEKLRASGMRIIVYLDDFLLAHQNRSMLQQQTSLTVRFLQSLGWILNLEKSILCPTRNLEFLGIQWDMVNNRKYLPHKKVHKLRKTFHQLLSRKTCSLKEAQSILGQLNFANYVIPQGRLHCRFFQGHLRLLRQGHPTRRYTLPEAVVRDLHWWQRSVSDFSIIHLPRITHHLVTDASNYGWGALLNDRYMSGQWEPHQHDLHSNLKELLAIQMAIEVRAQDLRGAKLLVQSDNVTALAYLRNQGGTKSALLMEQTRQICGLIHDLDITVSYQHLPGCFNGIADRLSRGKPITEWHLLPEATSKIFQTFGVPQIDLFASSRAHVVQHYVSQDPWDGAAVFHNAFSRQWKYQLAWVFPPPSLMPRVLIHLNSCKGLFVVIAPRWLKCFWRPDLQNRALSGPITLENLNETLVDMATGHTLPKVADLILEAWLIGAGTVPLRTGPPQERDVLMSGWRKYTLSSYKSAWRRWGKWCENNNISAISPQAKDLAKFLAHLHLKEKLAPSTIHLHRSVVSTICEPFIGKKLSDHIFVRRVLKSVSQAKPKLNRIPIWDPQVVVHWMQSNNPDPISLFEANRRCATILLLASGRRVHDLTLLYSSPEHIVDDGTNIILWPIFGSKTDSARFQQSGWKLIPHVDNLLNPVYWIRKVRELSSNRRGSIQQHFITTQGEPKPASRTVIANWVKTVLKAAGIEASPGSSRSAVASYNWLCNLSIDSILKKGNWKQASTFYRHYCKEVKRSHNEIIPNLSSLFDPV